MQRIYGVRSMSREREPSEKQVYKTKAKAFVESISRKCFGYHYKGLNVSNHSRRGVLKYKLVVFKQDSFENIKKFHNELMHRLTEFKVAYNGTINSKTGKEEWSIEIIVFGELITRVQDEPSVAEVSTYERFKKDGSQPESRSHH